jgi:hypothetical protein
MWKPVATSVIRQRASTAIDALIVPETRASVEVLPDEYRAEWEQDFYHFLNRPFPDDNPPFELGLPYMPGSYGQRLGDLWFAFRLLNPETILVLAVDFLPGVRPA